MKNEQFIDALTKIKPDEVTKQRLLSNILKQSELASVSNRKGDIMTNNTLRRLIPIAACCAAVLVAAVVLPGLMNKSNQPTQIEVVTPAADSPMGIRKFINYNGHRYAFLDNGATYDLDKSTFTNLLGELKYDITEDPQNNGTENFAATFAVGGSVYEMENYNPAFRVAVAFDGNYYICENVDAVGDQTVDVSEYFSNANFAEIVDNIVIYDHFKRDALDTISGEKTEQMIADLSKSAPAVLSDADYEKIGKAQISGVSFLLSFELNDNTQYNMYVIPTLGIAMIGDNKYTLSDEFTSHYGDLFSGLEQKGQPVPMG
ncbi:MAG: hypothetical protein ACK5L0_09600 [Candidatus Fimivivens sp.]